MRTPSTNWKSSGDFHAASVMPDANALEIVGCLPQSAKVETNKCLLFIQRDWALVGFMGNATA
jgi:hypothetical protein